MPKSVIPTPSFTPDAPRMSLMMSSNRRILGGEPGAMCRGGLGAHQGIGFTVIGAPFGMADDDVSATDVGQHLGANVAGVRAHLVVRAVLAAEFDRSASEHHLERMQKQRRRTYHDVASRRCILSEFTQHRNLERGCLKQPIHLPIAGD